MSVKELKRVFQEGLAGLKQDFEDVSTQASGEMKDVIMKLNKRLDDVEADMDRAGKGALFTTKDLHDLGQLLAEDPRTAVWAEQKFHTPFSIQSASLTDRVIKDLTVISSDVYAPNGRLPGYVEAPDRPLTIRQLLNRSGSSEDILEYELETGFYQLATECASGGGAGVQTMVVDNSYGFYIGQVIVVHYAAGNQSFTLSGVDYATHELTASVVWGTLIPVDTMISSDTFVYTPQAALKPSAAFASTSVSLTLKTLAHHISVSNQLLRNKPALANRINRKLFAGLDQSEERQLLYGDNSTNQIQGITTTSGVSTYSWSSGEAGDTKLDCIRRAKTLAELAHFQADGLVIHPTDWESMELTKDDNGRYIWLLVESGATPHMFRMPVVVTSAIAVGTALIGAFKQGATFYVRDGSGSISMSSEHADNYTKNKITILAERMHGLAVERPAAFVLVTFDHAPVAP